MLKLIRFLPLSFILFLSYSNSYAAILNYSGTYTGISSGSDFGCTNPLDNGPFSVTDTISLIQNGSDFTGNGIDSDGDTFSVSGTVDSSGNFSGTFTNTFGGAGSISGTLTSTDLSFSANQTTPDNDNGCFSTSSGTLQKTSGGTIGTEAQTQQSRQIVRATNSLIGQHLATEVSNAFTFMPGLLEQETSIGASSDKKNDSPLAFWGTTSLSEIHEDNSNVADFDTDIYQFVGGFDKQLGKLFIGSALTYAYGETEQVGQDTSSQVIGVTPYLAYQLTDFMFISGLGGYNYSYIKDENFDNDSDVHDYILESNLNFYKTFMNSIIVKSRIGTRFHHSYVSSTNRPLDATTDELVWLGDFELGYRFQNSLTTHVGTYYEYFDREESTYHTREHDGTLFMRGGFNYPIAHNLTIGGKVQADLTDEDTDIITGSINIRLAM